MLKLEQQEEVCFLLIPKVILLQLVLYLLVLLQMLLVDSGFPLTNFHGAAGANSSNMSGILVGYVHNVSRQDSASKEFVETFLQSKVHLYEEPQIVPSLLSFGQQMDVS